MTMTCTYDTRDKPPEPGELDEPAMCGRTATVVYERRGQVYPKCNKHNTAAARAYAESHGFTVHYLDVLEFAL
jgi:hypothetical protein